MTDAGVEDRYRAMFGRVPATVRERRRLAAAVGRSEQLAVLERMREAFMEGSTLEPRTQRLVHFALTLAFADDEVIALHARSARAADATIADLWGVCETAAIVLGMPAFTRGVRAVHAEITDDVNV